MCDLLNKQNISDMEYLSFLASHYSNVINLSNDILKKSKEDFILDFSRKILARHNIELLVLEKIAKNIPNIQSIKVSGEISGIESNNTSLSPINITEAFQNTVILEKVKNNSVLTNVESDFKTNVVNNEKRYIDSINALLDCGIKVSKNLLKLSSEPKILQLAGTFIEDRTKDMFMIDSLHQCIKYYWRNNYLMN
jgi:uncharacterized protein (DUF305 family)